MKDSDKIDRINRYTQTLRARLYNPLLRILTNCGITPSFITNLRLIGGIVFYIFFFTNPVWFSILLLVLLLLDTVDGALARFQNNASDRGKFLDVFVDHVSYSLLLLLLLRISSDTFSVSYNLFIIPIVYLLATIKKEEFKKSDWLIKVYPRVSYLKLAVILPFFLKIMTNTDLIPMGLFISNLTSSVLSIYYFIIIQSRWNKL